jgi:uncharacterized protein (UPF0297 family)
MLCTDPFVAYLKSYGYNVVRLPRANLKPLEVLSRQGKNLGRLGDLTDVMNPGGNVTFPAISLDNRSSNISGQRTSDMSIGLGLNILGTIIGAIGGSTLGLDAKYKQAKTVQFEFQDVYEDNIKITELDKFLSDSDINPFSQHVGRLLEADELYITNSMIKSAKFTVEAKKSDGLSLDLSIPEIQQLVGGKVTVSGNADVTSKVTYESPVPLVFGFQAVQLYYDQGVYTAFKPLTNTIGMRDLENVPSDGTARLLVEGPFVQLQDV